MDWNRGARLGHQAALRDFVALIRRSPAALAVCGTKPIVGNRLFFQGDAGAETGGTLHAIGGFGEAGPVDFWR